MYSRGAANPPTQLRECPVLQSRFYRHVLKKGVPVGIDWRFTR